MDDGQPVPQLPLNRTRHVISKPELLRHDVPLSGVEQSLVEELHFEKESE